MKIIVAGCNGNIGSYLCDKLNLSHSIFGLGTKKNSKLKKYFPLIYLKMIQVSKRR